MKADDISIKARNVCVLYRKRKKSKYDGLRPITSCSESILVGAGLQRTREVSLTYFVLRLYLFRLCVASLWVNISLSLFHPLSFQFFKSSELHLKSQINYFSKCEIDRLLLLHITSVKPPAWWHTWRSLLNCFGCCLTDFFLLWSLEVKLSLAISPSGLSLLDMVGTGFFSITQR